jgi:hypothetical protein
MVFVNDPVDELHTTIPADATKGAGGVIIRLDAAAIGIGGYSKVTAPSAGNVAESIIKMNCADALLLNTVRLTSDPALALRM